MINHLPKELKIFDLKKSDDFDFISRDTGLFFRLNFDFLVLHKAQLQLSVFTVLRVVIDVNCDKKGRFIITCSSSESLAERVTIVETFLLILKMSKNASSNTLKDICKILVF